MPIDLLADHPEYGGKTAPRDLLAGKAPDPMAAEAAAGSRIGEFFKTVDSGVRAAANAITFGLADEISAGLGAVTGIGGERGDYAGNLEAQRETDEQRWQEDPIASMAGTVGGALGAGILAAPRVAASLGGRMAQGAGLGAGSGAAYGFGSGEGVEDRIAGALYGGIAGAGLGGAAPLVITGAGAGINALRETASRRINALARPQVEASRRVGNALAIDRATPGVPVINQLDEASAAINQQQLLNVDRGGEYTRALARSAANVDPEARAIIERTASDRFGAQGDRARSFISRIMGGKTDDLAYQDSIREAAARSNRPAYNKAMNAPAAQVMWNEGFEQLMTAPAMQTAARQATTRGANRAAAEGFQPIRNPFVEAGGRLYPKKGVAPTLAFWDQVKRNLDGMIGRAQRAGDKTQSADLMSLKTRLVGMLDEAVPEYKAARAGAAAFFDAEDALEAGRKFVTQNRKNAEVSRILGKMTDTEREAFSVGFASELRDAVSQAGDRTNVIARIFGSDQAREKVRLALGPQRYREFEQFVKVEAVMDRLRGALGNSTTARQLAELGLAGTVGTGAGVMTGDWQTGVAAALLTRGGRAVGRKIEDNVARQVARLLVSDDPKSLEKAAQLAAKNRNVAAAIDHLFGQIGKGGAVAGGQNAPGMIAP